MRLSSIPSERRTKLKQLIVSDFWRKLLAVFLAALLYYYGTTKTRENHTPERISGVPVEIELPPDAVNTDRGVAPVTLQVTGSPDDIKNLTPSSFFGKIKVVSFVSRKPYRHKLSPSDFKGPAGVTIQSVEPRELVLNIENVITRRIPIEVKFDSIDRLPRDYQVDRVVCSPDEVQITGPESLVNEMRMIATQPIPLDKSVTDGFDYNAPLRLPNGVSVSPARVAVRIEVARKYATRTFKGLPIRELLTPEQRATMSAELLAVPHVEVDVSGPESQLVALESKNLRPYLDLSELRGSGTFSVTPGCLISGVNESELKIKQIRPDKISVKVEKLEKSPK